MVLKRKHSNGGVRVGNKKNERAEEYTIKHHDGGTWQNRDRTASTFSSSNTDAVGGGWRDF